MEEDRIEGAPDERILLEIPAKLCLSKRHTKGSLHMTFSDVSNDIFIPDPDAGDEDEIRDDQRIMTIIGCLGGGIEIQDRLTGDHWFISFLDIANAYRPTQLERMEDGTS